MVYYDGTVKDPNYKLRFMLIVFTGLLSFGFALLWKSSMLIGTDFEEFALTHKQVEIRKSNQLTQQALKKEIKGAQNN